MKLKRLSMIFAAITLLTLMANPVYSSNKSGSFTVGKNTFLLDGKPFVVKAAEVHYPRIPRDYWEHRIKMCKALGMNTLCLYVFWNIHEQQEGKFDFTGNNDVAAFCRLAQKNGMYIIVRPGPYVCAEWEMGGLPWWLLKKKDIRLREQDSFFMQRVRIFEKEVGKQLAPLTIQNGGPIIMVQVENEYGSYGEDKAYVSAIRDIVKESGFDKVALFQCDWSSNFTLNGLNDLVWTMNFGTGANIDQQFEKLGRLRPDAPKMCSEFWSGWFDKWGARHETRPAKEMVAGIDEMLSKGISFSLYMTHGGTSFGHWAGANSPGFAPDVTSYDYDAPINEYGQPTAKFWTLRKVMEKYSQGNRFPSVPKSPMPIVTIPQFRLTDYSPLINGADSTVVTHNADSMLTFEDMNMGWGSMIYTTNLPEIDANSILTLDQCHDYAQVFINGKYIGKIDRVKNETTLALPKIEKNALMTIMVEGMGRINFGRAIKDYKGITKQVTITVNKDGLQTVFRPTNWTTVRIKDDYAQAVKALQSKSTDSGEPGYYRGYFNLKKRGDTFLNMESFSKGQVYVNGHAIGRFWNIGPQQTLYLPGCWLKKGRNEVIVLDVIGPEKDPVCFGQDKPELDKLNNNRSVGHIKPVLKEKNIVARGSFAPGNGWQTVKFTAPSTGRYLVIEALNSYDGKDIACMAELNVLDAQGKRISREPWTIKYADSEDTDNGNNTADKIFDLQESTYWSTQAKDKYPHLVIIDLDGKQTIESIEYLPRAERNAPGSIKDYQIYMY